MLAAFIKERHNYIDTVCLACCSGNNSFKILEMVVRRHMVLVSAYSIRFTVIGHINHNIKVSATNGFFNITFTLTGSETWAFAVYKERFLCVALRDDRGLFGCYKFFTEFNQLFVNLLGQFAASGKCSDADRGNRHRLLQQFYVWHNIPPKCMSLKILSLFITSDPRVSQGVFSKCCFLEAKLLL